MTPVTYFLANILLRYMYFNLFTHKHLDFDWTGRLRTCFDFYKTKYIKDIEFY